MGSEFGIKGIKIDFGGVMLKEYDSVDDKKGDMYYRNIDEGTEQTPETSKVAIGTSQQVLRTSSAGIPEWGTMEKDISLDPIDEDTAVSVADGKKGFVVPASMNGLNLVAGICAVHDKGITGATTVIPRRARVGAVLGDSTTQFDITDQTGNVFRYTYDATGTDPEIEDSLASLKAGDQIDIQAQNFNAGNKGLFTITTVADNYFQVTNAAGVAEDNKTIGTGSITPIKHRDMMSTGITLGDEFFAADGVVNTSYDDLKTGDTIYRDVTTIHSGTAPNGLSSTFTFRA